MIRMLPTLWTLPWSTGGVGQAVLYHQAGRLAQVYLGAAAQLAAERCRFGGEYDPRHEA